MTITAEILRDSILKVCKNKIHTNELAALFFSGKDEYIIQNELAFLFSSDYVIKRGWRFKDFVGSNIYNNVAIKNKKGLFGNNQSMDLALFDSNMLSLQSVMEFKCELINHRFEWFDKGDFWFNVDMRRLQKLKVFYPETSFFGIVCGVGFSEIPKKYYPILTGQYTSFNEKRRQICDIERQIKNSQYIQNRYKVCEPIRIDVGTYRGIDVNLNFWIFELK